MLRRATMLFALLLPMLLIGDALAQLEVTVRAINAIPQANIDALNAFGVNLTLGDINPGFCQGLLYDGTLCGEDVQFTAVVMSDPLNSGLASVDGDTGQPGRIHVFVRDITALTEGDGNEGHGIQLVDGSNLGLINLIKGDVIDVVANIGPFNLTQQLVPISINASLALGGFIDPNGGSPIFDPIIVSTADVNKDMGPEGAIQVNWDNIAKIRGNFVRFENVTLLQRASGDRPDWNFTDDANPAAGETSVSIYDTSIRYRNDKSDYPIDFNKREDEFVPPVPGTLFNIQGFLTYPGQTGSDPFGLAVPNGHILALNPMADSDLEILESPIQVARVEFDSVPGSAGKGVISADIVIAEGRFLSTAKINFFTDLDATVVSNNPSAPPAGDTYPFEIDAQPNGAFVTFWIDATDDGGGSFTTEIFHYRVIDGGISDIEHLQRTQDDVEGDGPFAGWTLDMDVTAVIQWQQEGRFSSDGYLQDTDANGLWSAIYYRENDLGREAVGTQVRITRARIEESNGLTRLRDVEYTVEGSVTPFAPKIVTTTMLADRDIAEAHEGMTVRVEGPHVTATNADGPNSGPFGEFNISSDGGATNLRVDDHADAVNYGSGNDPAVMFAEFQQLEFVQGPLHFSFGNYKIIPQTFDDIGPVINVAVEDGELPTTFALEQNYPNPFNPTTTINFELSKTTHVKLEVFDALGRRVATLVDDQRVAGAHSVEFNARSLASGVYMYRISSGTETQLKIMTLLK